MGRAPCCDKVGLKRGPWTPQEDQTLISFIHNHGHTNWRALPKQSGLLRCGKSCRLRWINYLRPDIKRGNFTKEEEDTIIQLHEMMGNRWSAIAGKLPGRTDNEIKNVWHTHLKKKLEKYQAKKPQDKKGRIRPKHSDADNVTATNSNTSETASTVDNLTTSPEQSYSSDEFSSISEVSSVELANSTATMLEDEQIDYPFDLPVIDETFWSEEGFAADVDDDIAFVFSSDDLSQLQFSEIDTKCSLVYGENKIDEDMDFWLDVFVKSGGAPELPEF